MLSNKLMEALLSLVVEFFTNFHFPFQESINSTNLEQLFLNLQQKWFVA